MTPRSRSTAPPSDAWLSAADAATRLGVSRATLYAYVSRGFLRSESHPGASRERRYARDDVERLRRRAEERRDPDKVAAHALQWGMPILESSITSIAGARLYYRGHDAVTLARTRSFEAVASLIWTGTFDEHSPAPLQAPALAPAARRLPFVARAQATLAAAAPRDALAFDLRRDAVVRTGGRILDLLTQTATRRRAVAGAAGAQGARASMVRQLARAWRIGPDGADVMRAALILCADHELNVSSFTARCVASAGSSPYAVVIAGLAALEGTKHGGVSNRVEALFAAMRNARRLRDALADRLRHGEHIDGFGHPLYPNGDPRTAALIALLRERFRKSPELRFATALADAGTAVLRDHPTLDFALATVARVLGLPQGAPLTLFALGRTAGWIGQAIEQYATGQIIRPRAKYVGPPPVTAEA